MINWLNILTSGLADKIKLEKTAFTIFKWAFSMYLVYFFLNIALSSQYHLNLFLAFPERRGFYGLLLGENFEIILYYGLFVFCSVLGMISILLGYFGPRKDLLISLILGFVVVVFCDPLIKNVSTDYLGWLCVSQLFLVSGVQDKKQFLAPKILHSAAFLILGFGYSMSGLHKILRPEWRSGTAIEIIINSSIGSSFGQSLISGLPNTFSNIASLFVLGIELSAILFVPFRVGRLTLLLLMSLVHVFISAMTLLT